MRPLLVTLLIAAMSFGPMSWGARPPIIEVGQLIRNEILNENKAWIELGEFSFDHRLKCGPTGQVGDLSKIHWDHNAKLGSKKDWREQPIGFDLLMRYQKNYCHLLNLGRQKVPLFLKLTQLEYRIDHCFLYPDPKMSTKSRKLKVTQDISESLAKIPIYLEFSLNVVEDNKGRVTSLIVENIQAQMGEVEFKKDLNSDINKTMKWLVSYFNSTVLKDIANRIKYSTEKVFAKVLTDCFSKTG